MNQRTVVVPEGNLSFIHDPALRHAIVAAAEQREGGVLQLQNALVSLGLAIRTVGPVQETHYSCCGHDPFDDDEE